MRVSSTVFNCFGHKNNKESEVKSQNGQHTKMVFGKSIMSVYTKTKLGVLLDRLTDMDPKWMGYNQVSIESKHYLVSMFCPPCLSVWAEIYENTGIVLSRVYNVCLKISLWSFVFVFRNATEELKDIPVTINDFDKLVEACVKEESPILEDIRHEMRDGMWPVIFLFELRFYSPVNQLGPCWVFSFT